MMRLGVMGATLLVGTALSAEDKFLREANDYYRKPLGELLRIEFSPMAEVGSRSGARDALEAEVPIDVITSAQLESSGYTELGKALSKLIPGFNFSHSTVTDGTDHAQPFTLRGLGPDQVLVLVNGKRQHQSSLLNINGSVGRGSSGVDINTIPLRRSTASRCCATARRRNMARTRLPASSTSSSRATAMTAVSRRPTGAPGKATAAWARRICSIRCR